MLYDSIRRGGIFYLRRLSRYLTATQSMIRRAECSELVTFMTAHEEDKKRSSEP